MLVRCSANAPPRRATGPSVSPAFSEHPSVFRPSQHLPSAPHPSPMSPLSSFPLLLSPRSISSYRASYSRAALRAGGGGGAQGQLRQAPPGQHRLDSLSLYLLLPSFPPVALQIFVPRFVQVVVEVPKGSFVKRHPDGAIDYVGCVPCPFNYGSVPSILALDGTTWYSAVRCTTVWYRCHPFLSHSLSPSLTPSASFLPNPRAGDPLDAVVLGPSLPYGHPGTWQVHARLRIGTSILSSFPTPIFHTTPGDPLDAVVLGPSLPYGHTGTWQVHAMLRFIDGGKVDHKLICSQTGPPVPLPPAPPLASPPPLPPTEKGKGAGKEEGKEGEDKGPGRWTVEAQGSFLDSLLTRLVQLQPKRKVSWNNGIGSGSGSSRSRSSSDSGRSSSRSNNDACRGTLQHGKENCTGSPAIPATPAIRANPTSAPAPTPAAASPATALSSSSPASPPSIPTPPSPPFVPSCSLPPPKIPSTPESALLTRPLPSEQAEADAAHFPSPSRPTPVANPVSSLQASSPDLPQANPPIISSQESRTPNFQPSSPVSSSSPSSSSVRSSSPTPSILPEAVLAAAAAVAEVAAGTASSLLPSNPLPHPLSQSQSQSAQSKSPAPSIPSLSPAQNHHKSQSLAAPTTPPTSLSSSSSASSSSSSSANPLTSTLPLPSPSPRSLCDSLSQLLQAPHYTPPHPVYPPTTILIPVFPHPGSSTTVPHPTVPQPTALFSTSTPQRTSLGVEESSVEHLALSAAAAAAAARAGAAAGGGKDRRERREGRGCEEAVLLQVARERARRKGLGKLFPVEGEEGLLRKISRVGREVERCAVGKIEGLIGAAKGMKGTEGDQAERRDGSKESGGSEMREGKLGGQEDEEAVRELEWPLQVEPLQPSKALQMLRAVRSGSDVQPSASVPAVAVPAAADLVSVELSLRQYLLLTAFFRTYSLFKSVINAVRGIKGKTFFDGWEVVR
ncbi:unnamed protein product [Closterium sp. NIES-53]